MTNNDKVKKVWIYLFYIWLWFGGFSIYYYVNHDLTTITHEVGPFLIPYLIFIYLFLSWLFLKKSKIFYFLKERLRNFIFGIILIIVSLEGLLTDNLSYSRGFYVFKGAYVVLLIFGICLILFGIFRQLRDESNYNYICVKCKKLLGTKINHKQQCPECNGEIVSVKSFVERGYSFRND